MSLELRVTRMGGLTHEATLDGASTVRQGTVTEMGNIPLRNGNYGKELGSLSIWDIKISRPNLLQRILGSKAEQYISLDKGPIGESMTIPLDYRDGKGRINQGNKIVEVYVSEAKYVPVRGLVSAVTSMVGKVRAGLNLNRRVPEMAS